MTDIITPSEFVPPWGIDYLPAAGALVYHARRAWQDWERGERAMDPAVFELFQIKTGQVRAVITASYPGALPALSASSPADPAPSHGSPRA